MPTIYLNGTVKYADLSPAANVQIKIIEKDSGPGGVDDCIYTQQTNSLGRFTGTSSNWQDKEGRMRTLFGFVDIPDILNLQFKVTVGARIHTGPFIMLGSEAAPIILPFGPEKPIKKENRELVQIVYLMDEEYDSVQRQLYSFIETGSSGLVDTFLGNDYKQVHRITGSDATLVNLKQKLMDAGSGNTTKAVDLIFCTHGYERGVVFYGGNNKISTVERILREIPDQIRNKFRMVFSTACFGDTHSPMWLNVGFKCASGSEGIYADSEASLAPFLHAWETEKTFNESISIANAADIGNAADNIAIQYYKATGKNATEINSNRLVRGNSNLRIYSSPE